MSDDKRVELLCHYGCVRLLCSFLSHLCEGGALHVFDSSEVSGQLLPTLGRYGALLIFGKFFHSVIVIPQVDLSAHQKEWSAWTVVRDLWYPLREGEKKKGKDKTKPRNLKQTMQHWNSHQKFPFIMCSQFKPLSNS